MVKVKMDQTSKVEESTMYKSCIKVTGLAFLPPLITPERSTQLQELKKKAVELEKSFSYKKKAHQVTRNSFNENIVNRTAIANNTRSLEHILAFSDVDYSLSNSNITLETASCDKKSVPNLTSYVFDVSEYSDNGIIVFNEEQNNSTTSLLNDPDSDFNHVAPKLVRSNSYTLESPSPILLQHLKNQTRCSVEARKFVSREEQSLDLESISHSTPVEDSAYETLLEDNKQHSGHEYNTSEIDYDFEQDTPLNDYDFEPSANFNDAIEKLLEKHFGRNNEVPSKAASHSVPVQDLNNSDAALLEVCSKIPDLQDILNLLERHKNEVEAPVELPSLFDSNDLVEEPTQGVVVEPSQELEDKPTQRFEEDPTQDVEDDSQTVLNLSTPLLIDFESDSCDNEPLHDFQRNCTYTEIDSDPLHVLMSLDDYQRLSGPIDLCEIRNYCNRELFPEKPTKIQRKLKEQWAATVLTAAAKGYLVRRLKRTDKVKTLIQTIHDSVVCAINLHKEDTETIQEADVELHRRLILQVSSACYEFYDVFFNLTTKEQMAMIAHDRQRQLDKLRRSSLKIESGRSTPKSRQSLNINQRKSRTPSFAA